MATARCSESGCPSGSGASCSYVDKRGRQCRTAWCSEHGFLVERQVYCRRHASTITALGDGEAVAGLPDVDNRAPSLVNWVGREVDMPLRDVLFARAPDPSCRLVVDRVRLVLVPGSPERRWVRSWKLVDDAGIVTAVSLDVEESRDSEISVRIDTRLIGRIVPPWIEARRRGAPLDAAADAAARRNFVEAIVRSVALLLSRPEISPARVQASRR